MLDSSEITSEETEKVYKKATYPYMSELHESCHLNPALVQQPDPIPKFIYNFEYFFLRYLLTKLGISLYFYILSIKYD